MEEPFKDPSKISYAKDAPKLKFNTGNLIASLIRTGWDFAKGYPSEATLAEWAKTPTLKESKERQAFNLVANSLIKACYTQIRHRISQVDIDASENLVFAGGELRFQVFDALEANEYVFDCHHRSNPQAFPLLHDFTPYYKQWLQDAFKLPDAQAGDLARDFPDYFAYELYQLLLSKRKDYEDLINWCDNPFKEALQTNLARQRYKAELRNKYHQPALGEQTVSLSDVYVAPSFLVYERMLEKDALEALCKDDKNARQGDFIQSGFAGNIHDYLHQHFLTSIPYQGIKEAYGKTRLMVLLGQPGHGKSSFCYRSIFDLLQATEFQANVFFVRLQKFDDKALADPLAEVANQLPGDLGFEAWVDTKQGQKSLLFLDGLDEFCMTQSLTDTQVIGFIQKCQKWTERNPLLHIVITSRFNYVETAKLHEQECQLLSLGKLDLAQQNDLVSRFMGKMPHKTCHLPLPVLEKINKENKYQHVRELIEMPILLQMVLIAQVDMKAADSKAKIYNELFTQVIKRKWDKEGRLKKYKDADKFSEKHLRKYLSFLAFKIYQSKRGYLNKSDIAGYDETKDFSKKLKLENAGEDLQPVLKDILTSFYLNETRKDGGDKLQADNDNEYAIEFLHKSLYEYLACEYIWVATHAFFLEKDPDGDGYKTRSRKEVQEKIQELYGTVRLMAETLEYLQEIVARDTQHHAALAKEMAEHFPKLMKHGFLYEYKAHPTEAPRYRPEQMVLNVFHSYWAILGSLRLHEVEVGRYMETDWKELVDKELNKEKIEILVQAYYVEMEGMKEINWLGLDMATIIETEKEGFTRWATALFSINKQDNDQKENSYQDWARRHLLSEQASVVMEMQNRAIANCQEDFLRHIRLLAAEGMWMGLNLSYLSLKGISLNRIQASKIRLNGANLGNAFLEKANLGYANLGNANLGNAYLRNADLGNANLRSADLGYAFLWNADFWYADLGYAFLGYAFLRYANLMYASLGNADLWSADLRSADLGSADLRSAKFENSDLTNAKLNGAKTDDINWLENLSTIGVKGAEELQQKYRVNPEKKVFEDRYGGTWEGYVIEEV